LLTGGFSFKINKKSLFPSEKRLEDLISSHLLSSRKVILSAGISTVPYWDFPGAKAPHFTMVLRSVAAASSGQVPLPLLIRDYPSFNFSLKKH
jgi:hypothetical protein